MPVSFQVDGPGPEDWDEIARIGLQAIDRAMELMALDVWGNVAREAPVDQGRLAGSFQLNKEGEGEYRIWTDVHYARFVHDGTGIYGEFGERIVPVAAQALAFMWRGEEFVRASVAGQEANPYADRAIERSQSRAQEFATMAVEEAS